MLLQSVSPSPTNIDTNVLEESKPLIGSLPVPLIISSSSSQPQSVFAETGVGALGMATSRRFGEFRRRGSEDMSEDSSFADSPMPQSCGSLTSPRLFSPRRVSPLPDKRIPRLKGSGSKDESQSDSTLSEKTRSVTSSSEKDEVEITKEVKNSNVKV